MSNVAIVYWSGTGNTEAMADFEGRVYTDFIVCRMSEPIIPCTKRLAAFPQSAK